MTSTPPNRGATPVAPDGDRRRKRFPWWILAAIAAVVALLLLLSQCGGDDDATTTESGGSPTGSSSTSPSASASPSDGASSGDASASASASGSSGATSGSGAAGEGATAGALTAGGTDLLTPQAQQDLAQFADQPAEARSVQVLSVPADEGFWVGSGEQDRVWVQLTEVAAESPYQVAEGDLVQFTGGTVVPHTAGFAEQVGVDAAEGAEQLDGQTAHVEVPQAAVQLAQQ